MKPKEIAERLAEAHDRMAVLEGVDNDDLYIMLVAATTIAQARAEGRREMREEAAKVAEDFHWTLPMFTERAINEATDDAACAVQEQIATAIRNLQGGER